MGRVFTPEQILEEQLPSERDFETALAGFQDAVEVGIDQGLVVGSIVYGSVAAGRTTVRSDFDAIVAFLSSESLSEIDFINRQAYLGGNSRVPIHSVPYTIEALTTGNHEIDRYFGHHLSEGKRIVQGEDIAHAIAYPATSASERMKDYLHHKSYSLRKGFGAQGDERDIYGQAGRVLELPMAVGRKILRVLDEIEGTGQAVADSANKADVRHKALRVFDELEVGDFPRHVLGENRIYDMLLAAAIDGNINVMQYESHIQKLFGLIPQAAEWLSDLEFAFQARVA